MDGRGLRRAGPRPVLLLLGVLGVGFLTHLGVFDNAFQYDDMHSVVDNPHIRSLSQVSSFFGDPATFSARPERAMFRPLVVLSYAVQSALGAERAGAFLLANLVAHLLCAGLVFALSRALGLPPWAAAGASLLFSVHPVNAEVVNYVSSRSESFAAAGVLAAVVAHLRWREGGGKLWAGASAAAGGAGLLAKATAIVLPAWLAVHDACTQDRRRWRFLLPSLLLAAGYLLLVAELAGAALTAPVRPLTEQIWTQLKAGPYYALLLAVPARLTVEHAFSPAATPWAAPVLLSGLLLVSLVVIGRHLGAIPRILSAWAVLALVPASLVPLNVLVNEHRLYLASACLAILAAAAAARLSLQGTAWRRVARGGLMACALLAVLAHQRSEVWNSARALWSEAVQRSPGAYRAHLHLGGALEAEGGDAAALAQFREAARLAPGVPETHYNLGRSLLAAGDSLGAQRAWERCLELSPVFLDAQLNLAALRQDLGDWEAARRLLHQAGAAHAAVAGEIWRRLGILERRAGNPDAARMAYETSLSLDPQRAETHYNMGNLEFETRGPAAARAHYEAALMLDPGHAGAAYNLADTWLRLGDAGAAERVCRAALSRVGALRRPVALSKLLLPLAQSLEAQGRPAAATEQYRQFLASGAAQGAIADAVRQRIARIASNSEVRQGP